MPCGDCLDGALFELPALDLEKRRSSRCPVGSGWPPDWLCVQTWESSEIARLIKNRLLFSFCTLLRRGRFILPSSDTPCAGLWRCYPGPRFDQAPPTVSGGLRCARRSFDVRGNPAGGRTWILAQEFNNGMVEF